MASKEEKDKNKKVEIYSEIAETEAPDLSEDDIKTAALAYAKFLSNNDKEPGDATFTSPEELGLDIVFDEKNEEKAEPETEEEAVEEITEEAEEKTDELKEQKKGHSFASSIIDAHDKLQDKTDDTLARAGRGFASNFHKIADGYRQSRRSIGTAALAVVVLASLMLAIFDRVTVYEYAYNGKVLGYVNEQEEVTDVLDIAGKKMTENNNSIAGVEFVANQNVSFKLIDGRGKTTDDSDTAVNKLIYMTDIETEASAVYIDGTIVAIVKDEAAATALLDEALLELGEPDPGMELVSAEFMSEPEIKPVKVLLSNVQSSQMATQHMAKGGDMETFHIVEEEETIASIAGDFGVKETDIYDEDNQEIVTEAVQGDRVCIKTYSEPVEVRMKEEGKLKIIDEYKTIKKESDDYYQGDSFVEQEGEDGVILFEGTIEKEGGEIINKDGEESEIKKRKDKIILVGTAERPKTAPTGTFAMPIIGRSVTSEFGARWGRNHDGLDFGAPTGTMIYASDGGTVIRSGVYSGYGNVVDIDHENGRVTRYAHCSKLLVSAGDKVYQGQEIALVGNTGRSFGSHLHFEIHINGTPVNPRPYLGM